MKFTVIESYNELTTTTLKLDKSVLGLVKNPQKVKIGEVSYPFRMVLLNNPNTFGKFIALPKDVKIQSNCIEIF